MQNTYKKGFFKDISVDWLADIIRQDSRSSREY